MKTKHAGWKREPHPSKSPVMPNNPGSDQHKRPAWILKRMDIEHPKWGWKGIPQESLWKLMDALRNFESMTWSEIDGNRRLNHSSDTENLCRDAQTRLRELRMDDLDSLYRFRLAGTVRVWGVRRPDGLVELLWYDPRHEVYPVADR